MRPSTDRPHPEEPWAKRLRVTRSRSIQAQERWGSNHLPSPKPTNPSSTDNPPSSSSAIDHKPQQQTHNAVQSLRERLAPLPKKPTPLSPVKDVAVKKPPTKPSVAPFFRRIEAAFQDKPATTTKPNHVTITAARRSARSPSPSADDLIQQLKEHYLQTATTLHKSATMRLAQTHADLTRQLTQSLTDGADAAFLDETEARIKKLAQPLDKFRIRSQQRGADGVLRSEENSVGELIARAEAQVRVFEAEVKGLWEEWTAAEGEVKELLKGVVSSVAVLGGGTTGSEGGVGGVNGDGEGEVMVKRFREVLEGEISEAQEEVVELGEEAVGAMKDIEKDFRKATLPDLHTFFQSIDEP